MNLLSLSISINEVKILGHSKILFHLFAFRYLTYIARETDDSDSEELLSPAIDRIINQILNSPGFASLFGVIFFKVISQGSV